MTQSDELKPTTAVTKNDALLRATQQGRAAFGDDWTPSCIVRAPGRLELLGNHIDYNGGPVLAGAIDRYVVVAVGGATADVDDISVVMADSDDRQVVRHAPWILADWRNLQPPPGPHDYVRGAIATALAHGGYVSGAGRQVAIAGDVPIGFGLSSSAALCVGLTIALHADGVVDRDLVLRAQEAEHRAGVPCGTMDQSASVGGGIIRYDGSISTFERLSPDLGSLVFAVADSGVHRSLGESSYPVRVAESAEALAIVNRVLDLDLAYLAGLTFEQLGVLERIEPAPLTSTLMRRACHVVTETARVRAGIEAVAAADWTRFGTLMTESGRSSATNYEISHPKVEELVAEALQVEGVLGARMMGGGEGGTALILLPAVTVPALRQRLARGYYARNAGRSADEAVHVFAFAPGAGVVDSGRR